MSEHDEKMKPGEQIDMIVDSFPNVENVKQAERGRFKNNQQNEHPKHFEHQMS